MNARWLRRLVLAGALGVSALSSMTFADDDREGWRGERRERQEWREEARREHALRERQEARRQEWREDHRWRDNDDWRRRGPENRERFER